MQRKDLTLTPGDTLSLRLRIVRDAAGAMVDSLAGWTIVFLVKRAHDTADEDASLRKSTADASISFGGNAAYIRAEGSETRAQLDPARGHYFYGLRVASPAGDVATLYAGFLFLHTPPVRAG